MNGGFTNEISEESTHAISGASKGRPMARMRYCGSSDNAAFGRLHCIVWWVEVDAFGQAPMPLPSMEGTMNDSPLDHNMQYRKEP
jgi:hypothetical protein